MQCEIVVACWNRGGRRYGGIRSKCSVSSTFLIHFQPRKMIHSESTRQIQKMMESVDGDVSDESDDGVSHSSSKMLTTSTGWCDVANYVTRFRVPSEQMVDAPVRLRSNHHVGMSRSLEQQRTMNDDDMSKNLPFERTTCRTTTELGRCCDSRSCDCTTGVMTNRCSYGHTRKINRSRLSHCGVG